MHRNSSLRADSSGSIDNELARKLHFRPISAAPLTPPKSNPNNGKTVELFLNNSVREVFLFYFLFKAKF